MYVSKVFKCNCGSNDFSSNGNTCSDDYMVEDDELTCIKCGNIFTVFCDDGVCSMWRFSNVQK